MGALFAKTGCGACFSRNKRKISPDIICEMKLGSRLERCPSAEIMKELNSCGFLATDITRTTGGLSFDIVSYEDFMTIPPRRSAAVFFRQSRRQIMRNIRVKTRMATIRRQKVLDKKAKAGKDYEVRRIAVLQRREQKLRENSK